jgi:hypothetical protein
MTVPTIEGVQRRAASRNKREPQVIRPELIHCMEKCGWTTADLSSRIALCVFANGSDFVSRRK